MTTPTQDLTAPLRQLAGRANEYHELAKKHAVLAVRSAIQCGAILREARQTFHHSGEMSEQEAVYGKWGPFLKAAGISDTAARRYMAVAEAFDAKAEHLTEGKSLCDLYRELGLVKPAAGGGNRLGKEELDRRRAADQLTFHFNVWQAAFSELGRVAELAPEANPFESLDSATLTQTRAELAQALKLVDAALASN